MKDRLRDRGTVALCALAAAALVLLTGAMIDSGGDEDIDFAVGFWVAVAAALLTVVVIQAVRALRLPRSQPDQPPVKPN